MTSSRGTRAHDRRKARFERFLRYRYTYLLVSIILLIAVTPFQPREGYILPILFLLLLITIVGTLQVGDETAFALDLFVDGLNLVVHP